MDISTTTGRRFEIEENSSSGMYLHDDREEALRNRERKDGEIVQRLCVVHIYARNGYLRRFGGAAPDCMIPAQAYLEPSQSSCSKIPFMSIFCMRIAQEDLG
jgi:hypothetical protein